MKSEYKIQLIAFFVFFFLVTNVLVAARTVNLLETGWKFINADVDSKEFAADFVWKSVAVPHDWAIEGYFNMNLDRQFSQVIEDGETVKKLRTGRTGALPAFGVGWYKIQLPLNATDRDKKISIEFDGVMSNAKVFLNQNYIGEWPYGYSSFMFDLTDKINFDSINTLHVRVDNKPESSRWYTGAGIYRNVRLVKKSQTHIAYHGTFIKTPVVNENLCDLEISTNVNSNHQTGKVRLLTEIFTFDGKKVGFVESIKPAECKIDFNQRIRIKKPLLWSPEEPNLYFAKSKVFYENILVDEYNTTFGCRSIRFDKNTGFFLNNKPYKIKGVCLHHDLGPLGAAVNTAALKRIFMLLKEMGVNGIRTAHNPASPEFLDLCDTMGFLVQGEAFDQWRHGKTPNDYSVYFDEWHDKDLSAMIQRDKNRPSIIMWSIGNEVREQKMGEGKEIARRLVEICKRNDPTRPTTAALNYHFDAIENGIANELDLVGFNYKPQSYKEVHQKHPEFILYGSETASTISSRGEYFFPVKEVVNPWNQNYQLSSYDLERQHWATLPESEFVMQDDLDFVFGEFVWTGIDYLGEPTPYNEGTPARSSYFGIIDLAGLKKDRFYLYQSKWSDRPVLHLLPHWNWPDRVGQNVPVFCYTNYPKAELFVNDKSLGVKLKDNSSKLSRYRLMWENVVYEPGEIKVIAYDKENNKVAEKVIKTAGEPYSVKLTADRETIKADGKDLSFVTVEVVDKDGNICPKADNMLFFKVQGEGSLKAVCNGSPIDHTSFGASYMRSFNGQLIAIVESGSKSGEINLKVFGGRLKEQELRITASSELTK